MCVYVCFIGSAEAAGGVERRQDTIRRGSHVSD